MKKMITLMLILTLLASCDKTTNKTFSEAENPIPKLSEAINETLPETEVNNTAVQTSPNLIQNETTEITSIFLETTGSKYEDYDYNATELYLYWYEFPDLSVLKKMTNVTSVVLELENMESEFEYAPYLSALTTLPNLTNLEIRENYFRDDISEITLLTNLKSLKITNRHGCGDLSPIGELINLTSLCISSRMSIIDISLFENLINLTNLDIYTQYGGIENTSMVSKFVNLQSLSLILDVCGFSGPCVTPDDLYMFLDLTNLTELRIGGEISDINALSAFTQLKSLYISNWYYLDDSEIASDAEKKSYGKPITDISPLIELHNLEELVIFGAIIDQSAWDNLKENLKNCEIEYSN